MASSLMRDHPFSFEELSTFSNSIPYSYLSSDVKNLFTELNNQKSILNFPAINNDIGSFISFMLNYWKPKTVFEMGSGYGHSAFWYLNSSISIDRVILTEKRDDLESIFNSLPWPPSWKEKLEYHNADAFEVIENIDSIDLALIDGVKADYLSFLEKLESRISKNGIVLIDNSYWRGSFLDSELVAKKNTAKKIFDLHQFLRETKNWESIFVPFVDGLSILRKI